MAESIVAWTGELWSFKIGDRKLDGFYQENLIGLEGKAPGFFSLSVKSENLQKSSL